jgi:hypothetical protein
VLWEDTTAPQARATIESRLTTRETWVMVEKSPPGKRARQWHGHCLSNAFPLDIGIPPGTRLAEQWIW